MDQGNWIYVKDQLPAFNEMGLTKRPLLVCAAEFGQQPRLAICRPWRSSLAPNEPKWYLDMEFYDLDRPWEIAEEVYAWQEIPEPAQPPKRGITYVLPTD